MTAARYLMSVLRAVCFGLWTGTAAAAAGAIVIAPRTSGSLFLDPLVLAVSWAIATTAGVTALVIRINMHLAQHDPNDPKPIIRPWLFAIAHMGGSYLAGVGGLLVASVNKFEVDNTLLIVLVASFAGSKFLEFMAEKIFPSIKIMPMKGLQ